MSAHKIGRNEPCPCHSGKKYKHCCLHSLYGLSQAKLAVGAESRASTASLENTLQALQQDTQSRCRNATVSHAVRSARALLEADLIGEILTLKPPSFSAELEKRFSPLLQRSSMSEWECLYPHALATLGSSSGLCLSAQGERLPATFGLEIGRVEIAKSPSGNVLKASELRLALEQECALSPAVSRAFQSVSFAATARCIGIQASNVHLYEALFSRGTLTERVPFQSLWMVPPEEHSTFSKYEHLFVTLGTGLTKTVVSLDRGRILRPGTGAFLEALSPFARKHNLPHWHVEGEAHGARRASMLLALLSDSCFTHLFLPYSSETENPTWRSFFHSFPVEIKQHVYRTSQRVTANAFARAILLANKKNVWFSAFLEGILSKTAEGEALREAFTPHWDAAVASGGLSGFPLAKPLLKALGAPQGFRASKTSTTSKGSKVTGGATSASGARTARRDGLWRARRSDTRASSLSETKLRLTADRLENLAAHTLHMRGLPQHIRFKVLFVQNENAPEAAWDGLSNTLTLRTSVLEHPWRHVCDTVMWGLAQCLEVLYARGQLPEEEPHAQGISAWALACRRLCLRAEFFAHKGVLKEVPDEAWLGRENLDEEEQRFLEKVDKLLNLSTSANEHEASLAMARAQQLLNSRRKEHRAGAARAGAQASEHAAKPYVSLTLSLGVKKVETVTSAIASVLATHYAVSVIWGTEYDAAEAEFYTTLTIVGRKENVLMAEHVFDFLSQQAQSLWLRARKEQGLDARMRLSFQFGLIQGFSGKLATAQKENPSTAGTHLNEEFALVRLEQANLEAYMQELFPSQSTRARSGAKLHSEGVKAGKEEGKRLTLHAPVEAGGEGSHPRSPRLLS